VATIDDIINGSFGAIRGMPPDNRNQLNNWMVDNALKDAVPQRFALDGAGKIVQPIGMQPGIPQGDMVPPAEVQYANAAPIPQTRPSMLSMFPDSGGMANPAVAATTGAGNPVSNVQGTMLPRRSGGGFLEMLFGPSKNGMSGLPGLLGGSGAGGILGMLSGSDGAAPRSLPRKSTVNHKAARDAAERSGQTVSGTPSSSGRYYNSDTNTWM
jgi:hypothetical protein